MATGTLESAAPGDGKTAWCAAQDGTATGCEATVVDPVILVGLIFNFTKLKWQTLGDSLLFNLAYILASCQITSFAKLILANSWRCSKTAIGNPAVK